MPFHHIGRAWGIYFAHRRGDVLHRQLEQAVAEQLPDVSHDDAAARPTITKAYDSTNALIDMMRKRAVRLEDTIATAQEELRQVAIVIDGATTMRDKLAEGMDTPTLGSPLERRPIFSQEPLASSQVD